MAPTSTPSDSDQSGKNLRGPQFPAYSLREAVDRARVIWDHEKRNSVAFNVLASHWGYSVKSSNARGVIASLTKYGLVENKSGEYRLTNRALSILLAEGGERAQAIKEAALAPRVFSDLWSRYGCNLPSVQSLTHKLVIEGFHPSSIPGLIKDWQDTIEFAELKSGDTVDNAPDESDIDTPILSKPTAPTSVVAAGPIRQQAQPSSPTMNPALRYLPVPLLIGDAQIPMGMTGDDFDLLLQSLKLWRPRIVAAQKQEPQPDLGDATPAEEGADYL